MTTMPPERVLTLQWNRLGHGDFAHWVMTSGLQIVMLLAGSLLAVRIVNWVTQKVIWGLDVDFLEGEMLVRSENTKHRQALASVISWVSILFVYVIVALELVKIFDLPLSALAAPAAALGVSLGWGGRGVIEDLLAGLFVIAEKQYGFGDLVELELASTAVAAGTVEDVTLRVTKLRSSDGELYTIGNGKVVKATNLSKDWARAVVDIPVPLTADLGLVHEVLRQECITARDDALLGQLLVDPPSVMGVESIEVGTVNLRMVARTLPGRQFEAGRHLRDLVVRALARAGIVTIANGAPSVEAITPPATVSGTKDETTNPAARP